MKNKNPVVRAKEKREKVDSKLGFSAFAFLRQLARSWLEFYSFNVDFVEQFLFSNFFSLDLRNSNF